jgi:TonB family protein
VIDRYARMCVFCNKDPYIAPTQQAGSTTAEPVVPIVPTQPLPQQKRRFAFSQQKVTTRALMIAAVAALLMATFAVGGLVYGIGKDKTPGLDEQEEAQRVGMTTAPTPTGDVAMNLGAPVVVTDSNRVLTSAPLVVGNTSIPGELQRTDATALPSEQYARIVAQQPNIAATQTGFQTLDPRTVQTPPPGTDLAAQQQTPAPRREPVAPVSHHNGKYQHPRPLNQSLPNIGRVTRGGTVRLSLTINEEGRVDEIQVLEGVPGLTAKVIAGVQRWRFQPARIDGKAVPGKFPVDISFNADE